MASSVPLPKGQELLKQNGVVYQQLSDEVHDLDGIATFICKVWAEYEPMCHCLKADVKSLKPYVLSMVKAMVKSNKCIVAYEEEEGIIMAVLIGSDFSKGKPEDLPAPASNVAPLFDVFDIGTREWCLEYRAAATSADYQNGMIIRTCWSLMKKKLFAANYDKAFACCSGKVSRLVAQKVGGRQTFALDYSTYENGAGVKCFAPIAADETCCSLMEMYVNYE